MHPCIGFRSLALTAAMFMGPAYVAAQEAVPAAPAAAPSPRRRRLPWRWKSTR
ncbi:hypothetical protein VT85_23145 [Planctomyces sp. SH-PL62]|nr:hypothetical protein VT85_23145 [Planctomyces sp. SH-PL62]